MKRWFLAGSVGSLAAVVNYSESSTANVLDIDAHDGLGGGNDVSVSYRLEGEDASLFSIDASGILTFLASPAYDEPIDHGRDNVYEITVVAASTVDESSQALEIRVTDNDLDEGEVLGLKSESLPIIYPNPVNDQFWLSGVNGELLYVELVTLNGTVVRQYTPNSRQVYDISGVAAGAYNVIITTKDGNIQIARMIKE